jgi:hypothetical protein
MTLKTLFLGSAAVFTVGGAAQAADLSVAEPVEYVRVCDGFGAGYWVIPGTDTCLKIGGYVQVDTTFHDTRNVFGDGSHSAGWEMYTEASAQFSAKSMTEYGELAAFAEFRAQSNNTWQGSDRHWAYLDSAYLKLGALLAGSTASAYDYGGGFTFDGSDLDSDASADQIRLSWAAGGFGLALGIEDPRDRFGSDLGDAANDEYSMPNIVGALTVSQANWDGKLSAAYAETYYGGGFAIQGAATFKLDSIAPGDQLRLKAAWAQSEVGAFAATYSWDGTALAAPDYAGGSVWSALASFQHFWTPQLSSAVTFGYASGSDVPAIGPFAGGNIDAYQIYGNLVWAPVSGFMAGAEVGYNNIHAEGLGSVDTWVGKIRLKRSW